MDNRLHNVDALRGFALLGIMMVNIWVYADSWFGSGANNPLFAAPPDLAVRFVVALLFEGKFYVLFAFLFGYSFSLQLASAGQAGTAFKARMLRRSAGLMAIGLLHGALLWQGDILRLYALLAVILLAWQHLPAARLVKRAAWLLGVIAALLCLAGGIALLAGAPSAPAAGASAAPVAAASASEAAARLAAATGSAADVLGYLRSEFAVAVGGMLFVMGPSALAMFLLGYAAGRAQLLARVAAWRHLLPRVLAVGLALGLAGSAAYATFSVLRPGFGNVLLATAIDLLAAPLQAAAYGAALLMLFDSAAGARLQAALAPLGKLALSNYLLQSLVMALLFTGYGLRLMDRVPPLAVAGIVLATYAAQMALSAWWLRRYTYGPAEWLLRAVTNWSFSAALRIHESNRP